MSTPGRSIAWPGLLAGGSTAADAAQAGFSTTVLLSLTAGVMESTTTAAIASLRDAGVAVTGEPLAAAD